MVRLGTFLSAVSHIPHVLKGGGEGKWKSGKLAALTWGRKKKKEWAAESWLERSNGVQMGVQLGWAALGDTPRRGQRHPIQASVQQSDPLQVQLPQTLIYNRIFTAVL